MRGVVVFALGAALFLSMACFAAADPIPGRDVLKFSQAPMIATPIPTVQQDGTIEDVIYYGHDERSTAWRFPDQPQPVFNGIFMADDFADNYNREVVHIRWWGSYMNRREEDLRQVQQFLIAFESDVPADAANNPYGFSHPNCIYSADDPPHVQISTLDADGILMPMEGTFTEKWIGGKPSEPVYEYNAELFCPFPQKADTVYWLKIVALVDQDPNDPLGMLEWGWHNRDYTIHDPLASTRPAIDPGEHKQGWLNAGSSDEVPIWHFQDDAVSGSIANIQIFDPCNIHMDQDDSGGSLVAELYVDLEDGPEGISQYSKDLAFELFTVPEPGMLTLLALGGLLLLALRVRK